MNYKVTRNTASLIEAVETMVKANNTVIDILTQVYGDDFEAESRDYQEAFEMLQDELMELVKGEVLTNILAGGGEQVQEV